MSIVKKTALLFNTVKYLKRIQIYYRLYYFVRRKVRKANGFTDPLYLSASSALLELQPSISSCRSVEKQTFSFLNLVHTFKNGIDWNFSEYGKLWTYNLSYFDYLQQVEMSQEEGLSLIYDFIEQSHSIKDGLEPFPVSLRGINWVKFLSRYTIKEQKIDDSLYAQYAILFDNIEYHLLGNHLLENGFSLLFGAYYFQDDRLYAKAQEILSAELEEQILEDGAHFELSPMYHQIMLFRVLDCINLVKCNAFKGHELLLLLEEKAKMMLNWLNVITFRSGSIPLFNDSANAIAPTTEELNRYAIALGLNHQLSAMGHQLSDSGYRKIAKSRYEMVVDIGKIGPDYIPGHAHADTFGFELYIDGKPFIVDTGLSTYETNKRRIAERSTTSHNTVEIEGRDQSEVWGGFRVADRAYVTQMQESSNTIVATHNGYLERFGILHTREWQFEDDKIMIKDSLNKASKAITRVHFHPDVTEAMIEKHITIANHESRITNYLYAPEFNKHRKAKMLQIPFTRKLKMEITL